MESISNRTARKAPPRTTPIDRVLEAASNDDYLDERERRLAQIPASPTPPDHSPSHRGTYRAQAARAAAARAAKAAKKPRARGTGNVSRRVER